MRGPLPRRLTRLPLLLSALLLAVLAPPATAHTGGTLSAARLELAEAGAQWQIKARPQDFRHLPQAADPQALGDWLQQRSALHSRQGPCRAGRLHTQPLGEGQQLWRWDYACPGAPRELRLDWLPAMPGHVLLARIDGLPQTLSRERRQIAVGAPPSAAAQLGHSLLEGLWHIAGGWDHLAFLLGLLLLARGLGALVALVTGFTLGHSAALLLSVLGGLRPPASIVEGAIAASIVYVGLPAASRRERAAAVAVIGLIALVGVLLLPAEWAIWTGLALLALAHRRLADEAAPPTGAAAAGLLLAASFGLLHGFGFAGAVLEQAGEAPRLWPLLLGFNLGVELGQLALILPAWWWLGRQRRPHATRWTQAAVCGLGAYWLTARLLAL